MLSKEKIRQVIATAINEEATSFLYTEGWEPKEENTYNPALENDVEEGINKIVEAFYKSQESEVSK